MTKIISITGFVLGIIVLLVSSAFAYTVDGNVLNDWGINLNLANDVGYLDTNKPTGLTVDVETEDNSSNNVLGWFNVGPGYTYGGTHNGTTYYGNTFDAEAMYFDNTQFNAYLAVISGLPIGGGSAPHNPWYLPGDIGIDADHNGTYEFAIDVSTFDPITKKALLFSNVTWDDVDYITHIEATPWIILSGTSLGLVDFVYSGLQNTHYVMEAGIPLATLGLSANPEDPVQLIGLHWTTQCGNDYLNLDASVNPIPEPATLSLLGLGLLGLAIRKKKNA